MSKTETKGRGRPASVAVDIRKNTLQFTNKTPREFRDWIFPQVQAKMLGGVSQDPIVIKRQKTSLLQTVYKEKKAAIAKGKKVELKGRAGKDGKVRSRYARVKN